MRLLPEMPQGDLHAVVRNCSALVNSSVSEGMSAAILEVTAYGQRAGDGTLSVTPLSEQGASVSTEAVLLQAEQAASKFSLGALTDAHFQRDVWSAY